MWGLATIIWVTKYVMNGKHPTLGYVMRPRAIVGCGVLGAISGTFECVEKIAAAYQHVAAGSAAGAAASPSSSRVQELKS